MTGAASSNWSGGLYNFSSFSSNSLFFSLSHCFSYPPSPRSCTSESLKISLEKTPVAWSPCSILSMLSASFAPQNNYALSSTSSSSLDQQQQQQQQHTSSPSTCTSSPSTPRIWSRFLSNGTSAVIAAFCVAPWITIIDRSIVLSTNGSFPLSTALYDGFRTFLTHPGRFLKNRDFRIVWGLYSGTYIASNYTEIVCEDWLNIGTQLPKFLVTSIVNISLCVRKDVIFAQMFSKGKYNATNQRLNPSEPTTKTTTTTTTSRTATTNGSSKNNTNSQTTTNVGSEKSSSLLSSSRCVTPSSSRSFVTSGGFNKRFFTGGSSAATNSLVGGFPLTSTLLFTVRDCLTIFASFNAPQIIANDLERLALLSSASAGGEKKGSNREDTTSVVSSGSHQDEQLPDLGPLSSQTSTNNTVLLPTSLASWKLIQSVGANAERAMTSAQLLCPIAIQFLSTPLHLWALDIYNFPKHTGLDRTKLVLRKYVPSVTARIGRIGPAFGIGGILNNKLRARFDTLNES